MAYRASKLDYTNYDYLSEDDAAYEGYDIDDDSDTMSVYTDEESEFDDGCDDGYEESVFWDEDSLNDEELSDDVDDWEAVSDEESYPDSDEAGEAYVIDGRVYKDPRQYISALYRNDVSRYQQLEREEEYSLACAVRKGMLCDCSIMPEDPTAPEEYPYKLVDRTSRVLKRLLQTDEEKAWVESLSNDQKQQYISEGRRAQDKLASHNLPLVMSIAWAEYNRMEYLDRVQAGNIGLIKAIQYYIPGKGVKFATFATYLIASEIRDAAAALKMQRSGPKTWENIVPTEDMKDRLCDRMGGKYWLREITVDTGQTIEMIRKQVGILLEQKVHAESIANDAVLGRPADYDEVLCLARESDEGMNISVNAGQKEPNGKDSDYAGRRPRFDIIKGDGRLPKDSEMSVEDYVRLFFEAVMEAKTVTPVELAGFILQDMQGIRKKEERLRGFLDKDWEYTESAAVSDLHQLINAGDIWPEYHQICQARSWEWKGLPADTHDAIRSACNDLIDKAHVTESTALVLQEGYVRLREHDIRKDAEITLEYYEWLSRIISITVSERVDARHREILEAFTGTRYKELQDRYHVSPNTINKRKQEACRSLYDQIIESTNCENGQALMKCLIYRYQAAVLGRWQKYVIKRIERDHYTEKERFALRSRPDDSRRPPMERFSFVVRSVMESVEVVTDTFRQSYDKSILPAVRALSDLFSSDSFRNMLEEWKRECADWKGDDVSDEEDSTFAHDAADTCGTQSAGCTEEKHEAAMAKAV